MSEELLPQTWNVLELGKLGAFFRGRGGTRADEDANGLPCIRYGDLYTHHDCIIRSFCSAISPTRASAYTRLQKGDIIFAGSGETFEEIGKAAAFCGDTQAYAGADTIIFRPQPILDSCFAGYAVNNASANRYKSSMGQGSSVIHISAAHLSLLPLKLPPKTQQIRIAEILENIDQTIAHTEALIQKYQQIKAGLMHDLFTRGINPDGKLRTPREQAPELYRESAIGWIPREWDLKRCEAICNRICVGIVIRPADYYVSEGVPTFRSANVRENAIDASNLVYISEMDNQILFKSQIHTNDILTVRTGYPGTSAVVSSHYDASNCVDILISTPSDFIDSNFLCYWINSSFGKEQVLRKQGGLAQQHFNVGQMKGLLVVLPDDKEQNRIVKRLDSIASEIFVEEEFLIKMEKQKSGLMHDLLTGKVPVTLSES
jgi:type I restriction enzyme, S subunit